jgi:hypothetical protein
MSFSSVEDPEHGPDLHLSVGLLSTDSHLWPTPVRLARILDRAAHDRQTQVRKGKSVRVHAAERRLDRPNPQQPPPRVHKLDRRLDPGLMAELVAAYEAGTPSTQLTKAYNLGKGSVLRLLREASVTIRQPRVMSQAEIDEAVQLYETGQSLQRIGDQLGWNHKTIYRHLKKRGVTMRSPNDWQH